MNDDELRRALRSLPVPRAQPGFTARVLRRVRDAEPEPRRVPLRLGAAAAAVALALAAGAWLSRPAPVAPRPTLAELEAERRSIEAELRSVERTAADSGPVLLLEPGEPADLVLDLGALLRRRAESGGATPVAHPGEEL